MSVAVVIPARDAAATLTAAVRSALTQTDVEEVAVAVGRSRDETPTVAAALAQEDRRVRVVANPSGTTPAGLNRAIEATTAPIIVRLDAHATLPDGYVEQAVQTLEATGAANVGGRQVPVGDTPFSRAVAAAMGSWLGAGGATYRLGTEPGPVETVYLGVFRRDALEEVGGFDERMIRNQDYELNVRLRDAGYEIWFDPRLAVEYRPRTSLRSLARQYFQYGRWRRVTVRLHPGSLHPRQLAAPFLVATLVVSAALSVITTNPWPVVVAVDAYLALVLVAAARAGGGPMQVFRTIVALTTMHVAWGVGFLIGPPRGAPPRHRPERHDGYSR